ncbi:MAG: hypothetical protein ICV75_03470 [Nitrospiraceae bacterium]|nr:hypothetical protein [Nitrospiraceae bacterium]
MSYRFNTLDIIVGVGMTAIVFGAILLFLASAGTFQPGSPQIAAAEPFSDPTGMTWLQPALGQAVVDQALLERRTESSMAQAVSEWNRATMASHELQSRSGAPFGFVMQAATAIPAAHSARVQGVMGRSVVNFTGRGVRSGMLSAGQGLSDYNDTMIRKTEAMGLRLDDMFAATWQGVLGQAIVEAFQQESERAAAVQERLGAAVLHVTQLQFVSQAARAENQEQLASLVSAAIRSNALSDRIQLLAAIEFPQEAPVVDSTRPATLPAVPMSFLIAALLAMGTIFFTFLIVSATERAAKAQAAMKRDTARWVFRMASS